MVTDATEEIKPSSSGLEPGDAERVWGEVVGRISNLLKEHVARVDHVAISGPNRLDLVFPGEYDFHKRFCERPEMMQQLEQLLREVTGGSVQVRLVLQERDPGDADGVEVEAESAQPEAVDPMVEEAERVFGAAVERVVPVSRKSVER